MHTATLRLYKRWRGHWLVGRWARWGFIYTLGYAYAGVQLLNPYRKRHWYKYWLGG